MKDKTSVDYINLVAPVFATNKQGNEGRLVNWLDSEDGKKFGVRYNITDLRKTPKSVVNLSDDVYDATIVFKGEMITPKVLANCSRPRVLYFPDDVLTYVIYAKLVQHIGKHYDIVYTFDKEAIPTFKYLGCTDVKWMPSWTGTDMFYDKGLKRDIDICFIGSFNEYRIRMMNTVKYFFKDKQLCFKEGIYGDDYADLMNRSKIVINAAQGSSGVSQRVFEASACGAAVFTNYNKDLYDLFNEDEIVCWNNFDDLVNRLKLYFDNKDNIKILGERGKTCTIHNHLAQHRFKQMVKDIETWKIKERAL